MKWKRILKGRVERIVMIHELVEAVGKNHHFSGAHINRKVIYLSSKYGGGSTRKVGHSAELLLNQHILVGGFNAHTHRFPIAKDEFHLVRKELTQRGWVVGLGRGGLAVQKGRARYWLVLHPGGRVVIDSPNAGPLSLLAARKLEKTIRKIVHVSA